MADRKKDEYINEIKQQIHAVMAKGNTPPKAVHLIEETLLRMQEENLSAKEALGFSSELIDEIYDYGFHLFQSGKFKEALPVFFLLQQLDTADPRFIFAVAATHHHLKNYEEAAGHYMLYEILDSTNPLPYYHMYDCFTKLGDSYLAINALKVAKNLTENNPRYAELQGKIDLELKRLKSLESSSKEKQESSAA